MTVALLIFYWSNFKKWQVQRRRGYERNTPRASWPIYTTCQPLSAAILLGPLNPKHRYPSSFMPNRCSAREYKQVVQRHETSKVFRCHMAHENAHLRWLPYCKADVLSYMRAQNSHHPYEILLQECPDQITPSGNHYQQQLYCCWVPSYRNLGNISSSSPLVPCLKDQVEGKQKKVSIYVMAQMEIIIMAFHFSTV